MVEINPIGPSSKLVAESLQHGVIHDVFSVRPEVVSVPVLEDACNAVRIRFGTKPDDYIFLARKITDTNGPVDLNSLQTYYANGEMIKDGEFKPSMPDGYNNLEDPRAIESENGSDFLIGLTAVTPEQNGEKVFWHPAFVAARLMDNKLMPVSETVVFPEIMGKNATPLKFDSKTGEIIFLVRHDNDGTTHALTYYSGNIKEGSLHKEQELIIPKRSWNGKRIGTVGKPIGDLYFIHGQQMITDDKGAEQIRYSIGAVKIKDRKITHISRNPIIMREDLPPGELHNNKIVAYSTDNAEIDPNDKRYIRLAVSYGDKSTGIVCVLRKYIEDQLEPVNQPAKPTTDYILPTAA